MKNLRTVVALAVKVEKSNCKRLHSRSKLTEVKDELFRDWLLVLSSRSEWQ